MKKKTRKAGEHHPSLDPLTDFQKAILWAVEKSPGYTLSTWGIAQLAFPEKWINLSGRGALIGHIDRAAMKMKDFFVRSGPKDRFDTDRISLTAERMRELL